MTAFSYHSCYSPLHLSGPSAQQAFYSASFTEHRGSARQNQRPPHPPRGWGGGHVFTRAHANSRRPHLPSVAQPPTSRTTRRPMGPTTDATPWPQAGAMLGRDLQPPTSGPGGGMAPPHGPSQRGLKPSVSRGSVCRDKKRGRERAAGESRGPSWGKQQEDHRGADESHGMRGRGLQDNGG